MKPLPRIAILLVKHQTELPMKTAGVQYKGHPEVNAGFFPLRVLIFVMVPDK